MIEKINIPLVYDDPPKSNIWWNKQNEIDFTNFHASEVHGVLLPWALRIFEPLLSIHSPNEIKDLDWFIYPVIFNEPYYQIRTLTGIDHADFGFWSYVSSEVIEALKAKKGWILIDVALEPLSDTDLSDLLDKLDDCSEYPNDRIILNVGSLTHTSHPQIYHITSWLEAHYVGVLVDNDKEFVFEDLPRSYLKKVMFNTYWKDNISEHKRFSLFNSRYWKSLQLTAILSVLDRKSLFKYGHVTANSLDMFEEYFTELLDKKPEFKKVFKPHALKNKDDIINFPEQCEPYIEKCDFNIVAEAYSDQNLVAWPFLTEKTWRCVGFKKPFVLLGQQGSISKLHAFGYKTFHPYIDETYDGEKDDYKRFSLATKEVIKLIQLSDEDFSFFNEYFKFITDFNEQNFRKRLYKSYRFFKYLSEGELKTYHYIDSFYKTGS